MTARKDLTALILIALALVVVAGAFVVSDGLFTIDELIYYLASDAFARSGSFSVSNGFETYGSPDLRLWFLIEGPNGLSPQYPPGEAILGAPLTALFGVRGLILLNALAGAGVLLLTYRLAWRMHTSRIVGLGAVGLLVFGSFFLEYAYGVWPHMLHTFFVLAAVLFGFEATDPDGKRPFLAAICSGILVGYAFLIRQDGILILPGIGALVLLYASRPFRILSGGALGLAPALVLTALVNWEKFGSFNPLSYGGAESGGGSDPSSHIAATVLILAIFLIAGFARNLTWRTSMKGPVLLAMALAIGAGAFIGPARAFLIDYLAGLEALVYDMTRVVDERGGVQPLGDGTVLFWGAPKKALAQSLPWLAVMALLLVRPWGDARRAHMTVLFAVGFWTLPFLLLVWHGGFSNNMRYFMPVVPLLAIAGAALWRDAVRGIDAPERLLLFGLIGGYALVQAWPMLSPTGIAGAHQILPQMILSVTGLIVVLVGSSAIAGETARRMLHGTLAMTAGAALALGPGYDLPASQKTRQTVAQAADSLAALDGPALFYGGPIEFVAHMGQPDRMVAIPERLTAKIDPGLIHDALKDGYRVYMRRHEGERLLADEPALRATGFRWKYGIGELIEVIPQSRPAVDSRLASYADTAR